MKVRVESCAQLAGHQDGFVVADHIQGHPGRAAAIGEAAGALDLLGVDGFAFAHRVVGQRDAAETGNCSNSCARAGVNRRLNVMV